MIRSATNSDCEPIARALWRIWHHLKARQMGAFPRNYSSVEALAAAIGGELGRWLVCESTASQPMGFFSFSRLGGDKTIERLRFPARSISIESFACLLTGEVLLKQLRLLAGHFQDDSILICIPTALRDAYWASLKADFRLLGESPLMVGTFAWLYLDRQDRFNEIQAKLRRANIIIAETDDPANGNQLSRSRSKRKSAATGSQR